MKYRKRIIDQQLDVRMEALGGVLIVGPKGCGKTQIKHCIFVME